MTATVEHTPPRPQVLVAAAVVPLVALGIVVTAVLVLVAGVYGLLAGLVLTAVAVAVRARSLTRGIRVKVLGPLGAVPVDPAVHARLVNLADGLSATSGVPVPELFVLDDPGANLLVVGGPGDRPALVVTTGLLDACDRIQLEGIVARAFALVRQGDLPAASVAVTAVARPVLTLERGGPGALLVRPFAGLLAAGLHAVADPDRDLVLDRAAVALTRYPPGLLGALEQLQRVGTHLRAPDPASAHLWVADPGAGPRRLGERPPLELRIEALRLL